MVSKPNKTGLEICQRVASSVVQLTETPNKTGPETRIFPTNTCAVHMSALQTHLAAGFNQKYVY